MNCDLMFFFQINKEEDKKEWLREVKREVKERREEYATSVVREYEKEMEKYRTQLQVKSDQIIIMFAILLRKM